MILARGRGVLPVHYAWIIAGVTFLALLASAGVRATSTVLVLPLEHEFNLDRATVSLARATAFRRSARCASTASPV